MTPYVTANPLEKLQDTHPTLGVLPLTGRIMISAIFLLSGLSKIAMPGTMIGYIASAGLPMPQIGLAIAIVVEVGAAICLILGFKTRSVAAILAIFTLVTALIFHNHLGDQEQFTQFFKNIAMIGGLLQIMAFGAGRFSLDARRQFA